MINGIKKSIIGILIVSIVLTMFTLPTFAEGSFVTVRRLTDLRAEADTSSKILTDVRAGETFSVEGQTSAGGHTWYKISYAGLQGYVADSSVTLRTTDNLNAPVEVKLGKITARNLRIRKQASFEADTLEILPKGSTILIAGSVTADDEEWYKIIYDGRICYANASFIKAVDLGSYHLIARASVIMRASANDAGAQVGTLSAFDQKSIEKVYADVHGKIWFKITSGNVTGYVPHSQVYISDSDVKIEKEVIPEDDKITKLTGTYIQIISECNFRNVAGTTSSKIIGTIPQKTILKVNATTTVSSTPWYQVTYQNATGWVSGKLVEKLVMDANDYEAGSLPSGCTMTGITTGPSLSIRTGAGTGNASIGTVPNTGTMIYIYGSSKDTTGKVWYKIRFGDNQGYVSSTYVNTSSLTINTASDATYEKYLDNQGFPESYKKYLRKLHKDHPNWVFKAEKVATNWGIVVEQQYGFGSLLPSDISQTAATSLIDKNMPASWKSMDPESYNSTTKTWKTNWDGDSWAIASKTAVKYLLDPRNGLNDTSIFQFIDLAYGEGQNAAFVSQAATNIGASWLSGSYTHKSDNVTVNYPEVLAAAGKTYNINPASLVCIINQELGDTDTALSRPTISGTVDYTAYDGVNLKGFYNYYNIGAYTDEHFSKSYYRGLWVAAKSDKNWNTRQKALEGGAKYFADEYVKNSQETLYYKKFNVKNGIASHQFSTAITSAKSEGITLMKAYGSQTGSSMVFKIPIYESMPTTACMAPQ